MRGDKLPDSLSVIVLQDSIRSPVFAYKNRFSYSSSSGSASPICRFFLLLFNSFHRLRIRA